MKRQKSREELLRETLDTLFEKKLQIFTAESLTGGGLGGYITSVPYVYNVMKGGVTCYQNDVKINELGVPRAVIERFSAVSAQCAQYMARGAIEKTYSYDNPANIGIAVTGYAGSPRGFAPESESGVVYIALATNFNAQARQRDDIDIHVYRHQFNGDREAVRNATILHTLKYLHQLAHEEMLPQSTAESFKEIAPNLYNISLPLKQPA